MCVFLLLPLLFGACRSTLMQRLFRPKRFTLFASSSQWDPHRPSPIGFGLECLRVCACKRAGVHPPLFTIPHSARHGMRAQAPRRAPFLRGRVAIDSECFVGENGSMCHGGGRPPRAKRELGHRPIWPGCAWNWMKRRWGSRRDVALFGRNRRQSSEANLWREGRCQGGAGRPLLLLLERTGPTEQRVGGVLAVEDRAGGGQLVTVKRGQD